MFNSFTRCAIKKRKHDYDNYIKIKTFKVPNLFSFKEVHIHESEIIVSLGVNFIILI